MRIALAAAVWYMGAAACCVFPCAIVLASSGCSAMCDCADSAFHAHLDKRVGRGQRSALSALCVESVEPLLVAFAQFQHHADGLLAIEAFRGPAPARRAAAAYHAAVADVTAITEPQSFFSLRSLHVAHAPKRR